MAELADALDLGSSGQPWGFKSLYAHHSLVLLACACDDGTQANGATIHLQSFRKTAILLVAAFDKQHR